MKLTILGCSGSGPGPTSPASGYLVESGGSSLVLDLGNGTFGALQRHTDPFALDAVALSHLHADHCADFAALTVHRRYHPEPPFDTARQRLPVFAPPDAPQRLAALYAADEVERRETDLTDVFAFTGLDGGSAAFGEFALRAVPVEHVCPAWGLRVEAGGRALAYTGDTGPCDGLVELARGVDVLLSEASWPDRADAPDGVHLSGRQAAEVATAAGVGRLVLTHVQPWSDAAAILREAREHFAGPVQLAEPGAQHEV